MRKRVLVVDDEENVVKLISAMLSYDDRYQVAVARDGQEALSMALQERPDLVILDMLMPKLDGAAVCRELKSNLATVHTKVIVLSALTQQGDRQRALMAGADDFLTKPFSPTALLLKVEQILGSEQES